MKLRAMSAALLVASTAFAALTPQSMQDIIRQLHEDAAKVRDMMAEVRANSDLASGMFNEGKERCQKAINDYAAAVQQNSAEYSSAYSSYYSANSSLNSELKAMEGEVSELEKRDLTAPTKYNPSDYSGTVADAMGCNLKKKKGLVTEAEALSMMPQLSDGGAYETESGPCGSECNCHSEHDKCTGMDEAERLLDECDFMRSRLPAAFWNNGGGTGGVPA